MGVDFTDTLVIGVSSRSLFDLERENRVFETGSVEQYRRYQRDHEDEILTKGGAFYLVEALLRLNQFSDEQLVEVIVMSKNSPDTGLRVLNSIRHYGLDITRSAFSGGESLAPFLAAFSVDLLLTRDPEDARVAIDSRHCAAARPFDPPSDFLPDSEKIRIAFDADAVIFSDDSEYIFKSEGLDRFREHEARYENIPLEPGPFAKLIRILSRIHTQIGPERSPLQLAIVTARNSPAHLRVIRTLREWNVYVDQAFFLGGIDKHRVLQALRPHIFFDDQESHLDLASRHVPASQVPYRSDSKLHDPSPSPSPDDDDGQLSRSHPEGTIRLSR